MLKIGPHVSKLDTPNLQRANARENGWGIIQTFAGQNRTLTLDPSRVSPDEDGQRDITWVVHSSYPAHFVPSDKAEKSNSAYLLNLAKWCQKAGAQYMVVHLGATKDKIPREVVNNAKAYWKRNSVIHEFLKEHKIKLLIENVAAAYPTNQDLLYTVEIVKDSPETLGWCLDTAHSNAAGVQYDILQSIVENPHIAPDIIHCNYPGSKFGGGLDRHGWLYQDETVVDAEIKELWKLVVGAAAKGNIPLVVEGGSTPGVHLAEVEALRMLTRSPE